MAEIDLSGRTIDFLTGAVKKTTSAGLGLAAELVSGSQNLSAYSDALLSNTELLGKVGTAISGLVKFAEGSLAEYQQLSSIGATFGTSIVSIKQSAAAMGMEVKDLTEFLYENQSALRGLAGTTEDASQAFVGLSKDFLDSPLSTNLRMMGYTVKDINESLASYLELSSISNIREQQANGTLMEQAYEYAVQLDALSKLTGKNRAELEREMRERRRSGTMQAALNLVNEDLQDEFQTSFQTLGEFSPLLQRAVDDMIKYGGVVSEDGLQLLKVMPGIEDELQAYNAALQSGDPAALQRAQDELLGAAIDAVGSDEFQSIAQLGPIGNELGRVAEDILSSSYNLRRGVEAEAGAAETGAADVLSNLNNVIAAQQQTQIASDGIIQKTVALQEELRKTVMYVQETALPSLVNMADSALDKAATAMGDANTLRRQVDDAISKVLTPMADVTERMNNLFGGGLEDMGFSSENMDVTTDDLTLDPDSAAALARELGLSVDHELENNDIATNENITASIDASTAALDQANADLAALTQRQSEAIMSGQYDRAADLNTEIAETQAKVDATRRVVESLQHMRRTGSIRGFDSGGRIPLGDIGIVGERGPEIITGSNGVTSRLKTIDVMNKMSEAAKAIPDRVQVEANNSVDSISSSSEMISELRKTSQGIEKLITSMGKVIDINDQQLYTEKRTQRITKGLNGNLLKGVAR